MMRNLDRGELLDLLPDYVLGTLSGDDRRAVEAAIAADASIAREVDAVRRARAALTPVVPALNLDRVHAGVAQRTRTVRPMRVARWRIAAAIATLAVGGASLAIVQQTMVGDRGESLTVVGETTTVAMAGSPSLAFGYGLNELSDDELEAVLSELEKFDGLPAAEPRQRAAIVPLGDDVR